MQVLAFMTPAEKVVTVVPTDSLRQAMDLMLAKKIGSVVVLEKKSCYNIPIGILTKTDLVQAYSKNMTLDHPVKDVMTTKKDENGNPTSSSSLLTCTGTMSRDQAARLFQKYHTHHMIVIDETTGHFRGLISSWDITVECAKDHAAWPWNRSNDGRFHKPNETHPPSSSSPPALLSLRKKDPAALSPTISTKPALHGADLKNTSRSDHEHQEGTFFGPRHYPEEMGDSFRSYIDRLDFQI